LEYTSQTLGRLIEAFTRLPGIGEKSAQRIALYLLREGRQEVETLSQAICDLKEKVGRCSICSNLTEEDPCSICSDPKRDHGTICVVEDLKDLLAIERAGGYRGLYHILGGVLSPLDGIGEEELRIRELIDRIRPELREIVVATNPTLEGEMTAGHLVKLLKPKGVKITRIARGIPFGGALEFNDAVTVSKAMEGRVEMDC
jgi:recombination protein RecR